MTDEHTDHNQASNESSLEKDSATTEELNRLRGSDLLNRPHPAGYTEEWVESLKHAPSDEGVLDRKSTLIFRIKDEWLAFETSSVLEVTEISLIHKLPHRTTDVLLGVTNVQGELRITMSMSNFLGLTNPTETKELKTLSHRIYPRAIMFGRNKDIFVFPVDEVYGITQIKPDTIAPVPLSVSKSLKNFASGIFMFNDMHIGILDEKLIINSLNEHHL